MVELFNNLFYIPIYNFLIAILSFLPGHNLFWGIVILLFIVKIILLPLSINMTRTQKVMKDIQPELDRIKNSIKDPQEQAKAILATYRKYNVRPFLGIFTLLIQLPILIAIYFIFIKSGLPKIDTNLLYNFTPLPEGGINMNFLGLFSLESKHNIFLAIIAGITQFILSKITIPEIKAPSLSENTFDFKEELTRSLHIQMRYFIPVLIAIISYVMSAVIAIYFIVNNIFTIAQELIIGRLHDKTKEYGDDKKHN